MRIGDTFFSQTILVGSTHGGYTVIFHNEEMASGRLKRRKPYTTHRHSHFFGPHL